MKTKEIKPSILMLVVIAKNYHYARYLGRDRTLHIVVEKDLTEQQIEDFRQCPQSFIIKYGREQ